MNGKPATLSMVEGQEWGAEAKQMAKGWLFNDISFMQRLY
jgi:hypothetical protein